jgi:serine/threonine protein kinase
MSSSPRHPADRTFEYCCWLHPEEVQKELSSPCSVCGRPLGFPIEQLPTEVNGKRIEKALGRGFYGAVYKAEHPKTHRSLAIKLVPKKIHAYREEERGGPTFEAEAAVHAELSELPLIASLLDWGEETVDFAGTPIDCWWVEMEYVEGRLLAEVIEEGPRSPRQAAQIAWDLLEFVDLMRQRGRHHNDLHAENVMVVDLDDSRSRRRAIDPHAAVRILDLGSAASHSVEGEWRLGDIEWVAVHIREMVNAYERSHPEMDQDTLRLCSQLRRAAEFYSTPDPQRQPEPAEMQSFIRSIHSYGARPWQLPVELGWLAEHYNAQTLPPWYAPELLVDPDEEWAKKLSGAGPTLVAGMRGCGKTILLRSLEWTARLHPRPGESTDDVRARVEADRFLGLFVSCAVLLRRPRAKPPDLAIHRLFLAFSREIVRDLQACEVEQIGNIDYPALEEFCALIARVVPWFSPPPNVLDVVAIERALAAASQEVIDAHLVDDLSINTKQDFEELALATRRLVDIWGDKQLLFLLDDVSTRAMPLEEVEELLSQFSVSSTHFGFKVSTENQTIALTTQGGENARRFRDYDFFDLGIQVLRRCAESSDFIEKVLAARSRYTAGVNYQSPKSVLGEQSLTDLAHAIRQKPALPKIYWGIQAISAMCVGDVGDTLQLYSALLERGQEKGFPVSPADQHDAAVRMAEERLVALAGQKEWLFAHATAFSEACHNELVGHDAERLRERSLLNIQVDGEDLDHVFARMIELVDAGVFVLTGITSRSRDPKAGTRLQIRLVFSLILGLPKRVPLGKRDRFELPGAAVGDWLDKPTPQSLERSGEDGGDESWSEPARPPARAAAPEPPPQLDLEVQTERPATPVPPPAQTLHEVVTIASGGPQDIDVDWGQTTVLAGAGFEDRSRGAWTALLAAGDPRDVSLVTYPDPGLRAEIEAQLGGRSIPVERVAAADLDGPGGVKDLCSRLDAPLIAVDSTSLTKSLIYRLVRRLLIDREEVVVLHTQAQSYHPPNEDLDQIVMLFGEDLYLAAFARLDEVITGVQDPYETVTVGSTSRDPSAPSILAAFVPLKFKRLERLLEDVPVERVAAIAPVSPSGPRSSRTILGEYIARYCAQRYGGEFFRLATLDHQAGYELLSDLHAQFSLDGVYNFELALTGSKMQSVSAAMLGSVARPAGVYYSRPAAFIAKSYTSGSGQTRAVHLRRQERGPTGRI